MAQSRLERIGTIYTRTKQLLQSGAVKPEDKPLWLVVYEAFPPKEEPRFDRPIRKIPIRQIFYREDELRAKFHKDCKDEHVHNLAQTESRTFFKEFQDIYNNLLKEGVEGKGLYQQAFKKFNSQSEKRETQKIDISNIL